MFPLIVLASYLPYLTFDSWTSLQFQLSPWPMVLLSAGGLAATIGARSVLATRIVISGVLPADAVVLTTQPANRLRLADLLAGQLLVAHGGLIRKHGSHSSGLFHVFSLHAVIEVHV